LQEAYASEISGQWDEAYEVLTVDGTGEKFNFDGKTGDDGALGPDGGVARQT
jgi:hypothetical protein